MRLCEICSQPTLKAELKEQKALIQKVSDRVELNKPAPQTVVKTQVTTTCHRSGKV